MNLTTTQLTYHDYRLLPDDGKRYEIIEGDLCMTPAPVTRHQIIVGRLLHALLSYLDTHPVGTALTAPCDVILSDTDIVQPDVLFVHHNSRARVAEQNVQGPPDMVVEVLSPGTAARDRDLKRKRYEHFGVQEYWLIDPDKNTLEILSLQDGRYVDVCRATYPAECTSALLPKLVLDLGSLLK
ncbi:MAG: Uma2 family endonuclease [Nitrospirota bacterium]|nr:Uma2 family endonuclease [Nitrospirota bacterium]